MHVLFRYFRIGMHRFNDKYTIIFKLGIIFFSSNYATLYQLLYSTILRNIHLKCNSFDISNHS